MCTYLSFTKTNKTFETNTQSVNHNMYKYTHVLVGKSRGGEYSKVKGSVQQPQWINPGLYWNNQLYGSTYPPENAERKKSVNNKESSRIVKKNFKGKICNSFARLFQKPS